MADKIPGGLAKGKSPDEFDPHALSGGIKVEMEHTNDRAIAREIAMDHLTEDPEYYEKLKQVEAALAPDKIRYKGALYVAAERNVSRLLLNVLRVEGVNPLTALKHVITMMEMEPEKRKDYWDLHIKKPLTPAIAGLLRDLKDPKKQDTAPELGTRYTRDPRPHTHQQPEWFQRPGSKKP